MQVRQTLQPKAIRVRGSFVYLDSSIILFQEGREPLLILKILIMAVEINNYQGET